jgi:uncharacterized protein (DUF1810 family)
VQHVKPGRKKFTFWEPSWQCNKEDAMTTDEFGLMRFVDAQAPVYEEVLRELQEGRKRTHWMWYIFPQVSGLGFSIMAQRFAIRSRREAHAYLAHPLLERRLLDCTQAMLGHTDLSARAILGSPDDLKFRSSMTLFEAVSEKGSPFERALEQYYEGERDERTLALLR